MISPPPPNDADNCIVTTRVFDAPAELLFDAFTDTTHISNWWGPLGFTTTTKSQDLREGGVWSFTMHGPDGTDYLNRVEYTEIDRPHKLSYRHGGEEAHEHIQFVNTITFEPLPDGKTKLTMRAIFPTQAQRDRVEREAGAAVGGLDTLARFAAHVAKRNGKIDRDVLSFSLPSGREVVMRRVISAPVALVYECFTEPEHLKNWWGCRAFTCVACDIDFRVGGKWRIVQRDPAGNEFPFCGEIRAIEPQQRIQQTFTYDVEPFRDYPSIETMHFRDLGDKTLLIGHIEYPSQAARDGHLGSGMEGGAAESYDRLEELVARLK